jgi:hypothetical protein
MCNAVDYIGDVVTMPLLVQFVEADTEVVLFVLCKQAARQHHNCMYQLAPLAPDTLDMLLLHGTAFSIFLTVSLLCMHQPYEQGAPCPAAGLCRQGCGQHQQECRDCSRLLLHTRWCISVHKN